VAVLWIVLGVSLQLCASAWAKTSQTITLQEPSEAVVGSSFAEPGESSVGLEIGLVSETPSVCNLSYFGREVTGGKPVWRVALIAAGQCTVTAKQAGDGEYEAAEARLSFAVPRVEKGEPAAGPTTLPGRILPSPRRGDLRELRNAVKACKQAKSRLKRRACEKKAETHYRELLASPSGTAPPSIPGGVSVITVVASATYPKAVSLDRSFSEPQAVAALIGFIEARKPERPVEGTHGCPVIRNGELQLKLLFRDASEAPPVAELLVPDDCELSLLVPGHPAFGWLGPSSIVEQVERLLGIEL
jgi:hypothetical protein